MINRSIFSIFVLLCGFHAHAETLREYHQRQCEAGKQESCARASDMLEGERHAKRIVELGEQFSAEVDRAKREEDNKPILNQAYVDVLADYFKSESEAGVQQIVSDEVIAICADHYHNHWRNKKLWWPTNEAGEPDWSTIYYYIVDHYYGYCVRTSL